MGVCLVEDWGFRPGGVHSHFLPHNLYSFPVHIVGTPGEVSAPGQLSGFHQAAQNSFSGAFQNSNPNFHFYCPPHQHISIFKNQAPSKVKCHRTAFCRDQTVTERPVRPRVSAPAIVIILANVFMCHTPVTLIKSTYLLHQFWSNRFKANRTLPPIMGLHVLFVSKRSDHNWRSDFYSLRL